jgi:hypothetical protein
MLILLYADAKRTFYAFRLGPGWFGSCSRPQYLRRVGLGLLLEGIGFKEELSLSGESF